MITFLNSECCFFHSRKYNSYDVALDRARKLSFASCLENHTQTNHSGVIAGK